MITANDREHTSDYDTLEELKVRRRDGSLLKIKASMILEEIGLPDSVRALRDPKVPQQEKERVKSNLMKIAGIENPALSPVGNGQGFSIVINVGGQAVVSPALNVTPAAPVIEGTTLSIPFKSPFDRPAHAINSDLTAGLDDY